jgi:hypothetical protein
MKILYERFKIKLVNGQEDLLELIEDTLLNSGGTPLRWAVVSIENQFCTIESTIIKKC